MRVEFTFTYRASVRRKGRREGAEPFQHSGSVDLRELSPAEAPVAAWLPLPVDMNGMPYAHLPVRLIDGALYSPILTERSHGGRDTRADDEARRRASRPLGGKAGRCPDMLGPAAFEDAVLNRLKGVSEASSRTDKKRSDAVAEIVERGWSNLRGLLDEIDGYAEKYAAVDGVLYEQTVAPHLEIRGGREPRVRATTYSFDPELCYSVLRFDEAVAALVRGGNDADAASFEHLRPEVCIPEAFAFDDESASIIGVAKQVYDHFMSDYTDGPSRVADMNRAQLLVFAALRDRIDAVGKAPDADECAALLRRVVEVYPDSGLPLIRGVVAALERRAVWETAAEAGLVRSFGGR